MRRFAIWLNEVEFNSQERKLTPKLLSRNLMIEKGETNQKKEENEWI